MNKLALVAVAIGTAATAVRANTISGNVWIVPEAKAKDAIVANVPALPGDVSFDVNSPFSFSSASGYKISDFLNSSSAFNIVENTPGTLNTLMDTNGNGTLFDFKGQVSVTNGETFTVTHDDGLTLIINGVNLGFSPGPTVAITTTKTYSGPSGTFAFELVYGECCGAPAVLQTSLPLSNVPDAGGTLALLGGAMTLLGLVSRRLRK